ncbi:MAG: hypothetical protein M3Y33_08585 [Actinomycetota bacterium]|nr:hypothetical protein [Actinomycetota bacterium]
MESSDEREGLAATARSWRRRQAGIAAERDPLVLAMLGSKKFTKEEIHQLTGISRSTIDRIVSEGALKEPPA